MATAYTVRPLRAHEWREARTLRLAALQDDAARIAFLESHDEGARPARRVLAGPDDEGLARRRA